MEAIKFSFTTQEEAWDMEQGQTISKSSHPDRWALAMENRFRVFRFSKLLMTDWTQAKDSPLSEAVQQAWTSYRQALRDMTNGLVFSQINTEADFIWPDQPGE